VSATQPVRIGMLGGSFDPPHVAHHRLAALALDTLGLHALHVVPTGHAWHKTRQLSAAPHRLAMSQLAFADLANVVVDNCEIARGGESYTLDTLQALESQYAHLTSPIEWVLVIGWDQLSRFTTWYQWQNIASGVLLAVAYRVDAGEPHTAQPDLSQWQALGLRLVLLPMAPVSISSTYVRDHVPNEPPLDDWREMVSPEVAHYITNNGLYQA
jgi:nicotinate-nucleotide adenylyltransferase